MLQLHSTYTTVVFGNHCIRSTPSTASKKLSKIVLHFHHFLGQPLLVRCHGCCGPARLQDSKILRRHSKNGCDHYASRNNVWLHRNLRNFIACENHSVQARTTASSTNFKVYQWPFQKLVSLAPSKNRKVETAISLSHHTIPFRPTVASSRRSHASH